MKVTVNIQGVPGVKQQTIDVKGKKGQIDLTGNGTNEKLTILAKGICNGEKVNVEFNKKVGEKTKVDVKSCPKKQLKHFKKKCEFIEKVWENNLKNTQKPKEQNAAPKEGKPSTKVTVKIDGIKGVKSDEFSIEGKEGTIHVAGKGTDEKLKIVAKGRYDGKKVDVTFKKKAGKKSKMEVVNCPKDALKRFTSECKKVEKLWDKQIKKSK